jgi:hypothetical protein
MFAIPVPVDRWLTLYRALTPSPSGAEQALARAALLALRDREAAVAAGEALLRLLGDHNLAFAREALDRWLDRLP